VLDLDELAELRKNLRPLADGWASRDFNFWHERERSLSLLATIDALIASLRLADALADAVEDFLEDRGGNYRYRLTSTLEAYRETRQTPPGVKA